MYIIIIGVAISYGKYGNNFSALPSNKINNKSLLILWQKTINKSQINGNQILCCSVPSPL